MKGRHDHHSHWGRPVARGRPLRIPNLLNLGPDAEKDMSKVTQGFKGKDSVRVQVPSPNQSQPDSIIQFDKTKQGEPRRWRNKVGVPGLGLHLGEANSSAAKSTE